MTELKGETTCTICGNEIQGLAPDENNNMTVIVRPEALEVCCDSGYHPDGSRDEAYCVNCCHHDRRPMANGVGYWERMDC